MGSVRFPIGSQVDVVVIPANQNKGYTAYAEGTVISSRVDESHGFNVTYYKISHRGNGLHDIPTGIIEVRSDLVQEPAWYHF